MRYKVCPISPGNIYWEAFGQEHLADVAHPVEAFDKPKQAKRYALEHAHEYQYGLAVVDVEKRRVCWGESETLVWEEAV